MNTHKSTAKYCLKLQNKKTDIKFKCEYCDVSFSSKNRLKTHLDVCKEKLRINEEQVRIDGEKLVNEILLFKNLITEKDLEITKLKNKCDILKEEYQCSELKFKNQINYPDIKPNVEKYLYLNNINIIARPSDGYINATQLCKAGNKAGNC